MEIGIDTSFWSELVTTLPPNLEKHLRVHYAEKWRVQQSLARAQQLRIAKHLNGKEGRFVDGVGECIARITPEAYFYWIVRKGPNVWQDKQFVKEYLRDNPEVRVKSRSAKAQVGYRKAA